MATLDVPVIACGACARKFAWKPELAGKRVKCKCGQPISIPAASAPVDSAAAVGVKAAPAKSPAKPMAAPAKKPPKPVAPSEPADLDGLYALADDADRAAAAAPIEVMDFVPEPVVAAPSPTKKNSSIPLAYQRGQTAREKEKALQSAAALVDPVRDLYAPLVILAVGFILHLGYYIFRFNLSSNALIPVGIGVVILTLIKAAMLVGFALVTAGPLGVSFGGVWSAVLKLAAIAVFTDGVIAWVDIGVAKMSGGFGSGGIFGFGIIGFPVALGLYWGLLIYLFSMDPGDSWMVVAILSIFDRIVRTVLMILLLETILSWGGVAAPAIPGGGSSSRSASAHASALSTEVDDLKQADALIEARKYILDGHQAVLKQPVEDWYTAGCPNVWFSMSGDINSHRSATGVIVELPRGKAARAKCYDILQKYYKDNQLFYDPSDLKDTGEDYVQVGIN